LAITLPGSRDISFTAKYSKEPCCFGVIVKRFAPNVETLLIHIVITLYRYRFGHMCTHYRFVPLSLQENW
jgi:hypothetical protein